MAITMTDFAIDRIQELMQRSQSEDSYLRVGLKSGGCSGLSYIFDFVSEATEFDRVFEFGPIKICIDKKSYLFLNGMEIDYEETPFKSGVILNVPSVTRSCGCGESVAF
jgi:iron-sulfur cluster assembly protein